MDDEFYDDDDDDDDDEYDEEAVNLVKEAQKARGIEARAFFDNMAKEDDGRKREIKSDLDMRTIKIGVLRQGIRKKEAELKNVESSLHAEEARIERAEKKEYYATAVAKGILVDDLCDASKTPAVNSENDADTEDTFIFVNTSELLRKKEALTSDLAQLREGMSKEERARSLVEQELFRM